MLRRVLVITFSLAVPILCFAQARSTAPSIEGVWKVSEVITTGANAATVSNPQPGLVMFTRGHYSYTTVNGTQPRPKVEPAKNPNKLTDAEKIARYEQWNPFTANAGTYEVKGTALTRRPLVAKNEAVMTTNPPIVEEFKLDGNTLWLIGKSAPGQPFSETRTRLTRIQ